MTGTMQRLHPNFFSRKRLRAFLVLMLALLPSVVMPRSAHAQTVKVLYSFKGGQDGIFPTGVIRDAAGNLYGTTWYGGDFYWGTVFKLSKAGVKTTLYSFRGKADGSIPETGLVRDAAGNLYGTTSGGGAIGGGTVFKLSATGRKSVLHSFADSTTDGGIPTDLIQDAKGNLYGTTELGGSSNVGTVFELDTTGEETVLYSFTGGTGGPDGANPVGLVMDAAGNFYGTTAEGGAFGNWGTVFRLDAAGNETVLYSFTGGGGTTDGNNPAAGLVPDAAGNLYGTTEFGGNFRSGTIFRVDSTGNETLLYTFGSTVVDSEIPEATMLRDAAGNLYGSAGWGGTLRYGTVFKYDTSGNETVLHNFNGGDGKHPLGVLVMDESGNIYGTCQEGGAYGAGTVFAIIP
jgi:uncharacterized repeat protein (TIGR03803 family)